MATQNSLNNAMPALSIITAMLAGNNVTYAKIQTMSANTLLGNPTGSTATPQEITLGANLSFSGTTLVAAGGSGGPLPADEVTGTSATLVTNHRAIANNASLVTLALPATSAVGDEIPVVGKGAGGWKVSQASGQQIKFGNIATTSGATGYLASSNAGDCMKMVCTVANTTWVVESAVGNITYV